MSRTNRQASRWASRSLGICRTAPKSRSKATIRVKLDKPQSEHNWSAFGWIATKLPSGKARFETECRPMIQGLKARARIMRYELTDHEWTAIKPMLPNKPRGVPRVNDRRVLKWHLLGVAIRSAVARSARSIDPDFKRDSSLSASRLSCASPAVSASRTGSPLVSTTACILLVNPPRDRPMDCLRFRMMQAPC